jgi:hypothetical protein
MNKLLQFLTIGSALLVSAQNFAYSADDYSYGSDINTKRGDFIVSRTVRNINYRGYYAGACRTGYASAYNYNQSLLRHSRMILVPTSFYQGKDHVVAYNYRPVFVRDRYGVGRDGISRDSYGGYTRLGLDNYSGYTERSRTAYSGRDELRYRLNEPAINVRATHAVNDFRTVYSYSNTRYVASKTASGELPAIGEGPAETTNAVPYRGHNATRDYNSGER